MIEKSHFKAAQEFYMGTNKGSLLDTKGDVRRILETKQVEECFKEQQKIQSAIDKTDVLSVTMAKAKVKK